MDRRQFLTTTSAAFYVALFGGCRGQSRLGPDNAEEATALSSTASELARLDAIGQANLFKSREVTALELVEAAIERIELFDPTFNSVVHRAFDSARQLAASASPTDGAFSGVPYLVKSLEARVGMPRTGASRYFANEIANESDPVIAAAEAAGLIYLGNSNAPEFGTIASTEPTLYGATRNPWDLERSPAGSSGGSAAAVAAGLVPIATASDGGGSIRLPASNCGLVGLKASRGREVGHQSSYFINTGCVSRSVRDTAAFLAATERRDNPTLPACGLLDRPSERRLRVAFSTSGVDASVATDPEIEAGIETTAKLLESLGHQVEEVRFATDGEEFWDSFFVLWNSSLFGVYSRAREDLGREPDERDFEPWTIHLARKGQAYDQDDLDSATDKLAVLAVRHRRFFDTFDVQLTPTASSPPLLTGAMDPRSLDFDQTLQTMLEFMNFTALQNATGLPAISLPLQQTRSQLPFGCQFCANFGDEATLLVLAYELEAVLPWSQRWPPYSVFS
jgi:amidase